MFYGIVVVMFYDEYGPPYFHTIYREHKALVGIDPIRVLEVLLPRRTVRMVFEPLRDLTFFAQVEVGDELGTVIWPNGADFGSEFLYHDARSPKRVA